MPYITITVKPYDTLATAARDCHGKTPSLKVLQKAVGGYIETVPHLTSIELDGKRVRCTAYANEEGRLHDLPRNHHMSNLWKRELLRQSPNAEFRYEPELYGPVVFVVKASVK
jgi:hypothetical protein